MMVRTKSDAASGEVMHDAWPIRIEMTFVPLLALSCGGDAASITVSDPARFGAALSSKSVAPGMAVIVSGSCSPGVEPSLLAAAGGVVTVTVTTTAVCAGFQTQLTLDPHTQLPTPFVVPGSLSVVWV